MTADELRELADLAQDDDLAKHSRRQVADYLRACADALDAGPVAWRIRIPGESELGHWFGEVPLGEGYTNEALYPLAMPAQAQAMRLPEPMTDDALNKASSRLRDDLLDHIYEHTTLSEGILPMVLALCRAIEAETLRRVKEANK